MNFSTIPKISRNIDFEASLRPRIELLSLSWDGLISVFRQIPNFNGVVPSCILFYYFNLIIMSSSFMYPSITQMGLDSSKVPDFVRSHISALGYMRKDGHTTYNLSIKEVDNIDDLHNILRQWLTLLSNTTD